MNRRSALFWVVLAGLLLVVGLVAPRQSQEGAPLDPDATNPTGTAGLMELFERFGLSVRRDLPPPERSRALLLQDALTPDQRNRLEQWVEGGGTLVVTDPTSAFSPLRARTVPADDERPIVDSSCDLPGLRLLQVEADTFVRYPPAGTPPAAGGPGGGAGGGPEGTGDDVPRFRPDLSCFGSDQGDWLQVDRRGSGSVIALGGAAPFTNRNLGRADNAVVAVDLLSDGGRPGAGPVSVLYGPVAEPGTRTFGDLIPQGAKWAAWELVAAFALYVLWRARRLGRPVAEPQAVELPGSLLVRATGELQRRSRAEAEASAVLRADLEHRLRRRLKAAPDLGRADLAALAASAAPGLDPALVARALGGPPATDPAELVALVTDIDRINAALLAPEPATRVPPAGPAPAVTPAEPVPVPVPATAADRGALS